MVLMQVEIALLLFVAGLVAGIINAVAGAASIFLYPLALSLGLSPIAANATTTGASLPGMIAAAFGYRHHIHTLPRRYYALLIPSVVGGGAGAALLLASSEATFESIVPWFILLAALLLASQNKLHHLLYSRRGQMFERHHPMVIYTSIVTILMLVAIYGGYFGGGVGIMLLAVIGLTPLKSIHDMNALKSLLVIGMNSVALTYFVINGLIDWSVLPPLILGTVTGGWLGATYSTKLPANGIKYGVVILGVVVSLYLLLKNYM